jgi:hypothetical protein
MTNTKELPTNIETWVTALESGEYSQCRLALHNPDGYCCLGVYAKVVLGYSDDDLRGDPEHNCGVGSRSIYDEVKHFDNVGEDLYDEGIQMNDSGKSFIDIAKMIREAYT